MTRLMQELVNEMNYLEKTDDLTFPLEEKWENLPIGWMGFIQEVYIYAFPIKIVVNGEDYHSRSVSLKISVIFLKRAKGVTTMLKVTKQILDFDELHRNAWGQAIDVLDEIERADKEEELMDFLEDLYPDGVDEIDLNDTLAYDWDWVYSQIGMPMEVKNGLSADEDDDIENYTKEGE